MPGEDESVKCPECGAWTDVIGSREGKRRRECGNGHRFSTKEIVIESRTPPTEERKREIAAAEGSLSSMARKFRMDIRTIKRIRAEYQEKK